MGDRTEENKILYTKYALTNLSTRMQGATPHIEGRNVDSYHHHPYQDALFQLFKHPPLM